MVASATSGGEGVQVLRVEGWGAGGVVGVYQCMQLGLYWWTPVGGWHFSIQIGLRDLCIIYLVWKAFVWGLDDRVDEWKVFLDDLHFWHATGLHRREASSAHPLVPSSFSGAARGDSGEAPGR